MDWTFVEWRHKPINFVGWATSAAPARSAAARGRVEFEMAPLRHAVHILPDLMIAARQAGDAPTDVAGSARREAGSPPDDLAWWTRRSTPPARGMQRAL